jgi:hypothetical protein
MGKVWSSRQKRLRYVKGRRAGTRTLSRRQGGRSFQGINGVSGKGGSSDAASITTGDGLLFVNSGYGMFGETPAMLFWRSVRKRGD